MLRLHLMQNGWSLTDDAMENALVDGNAIRGFAGIDPAKDNIPDATIIHAPTSTKNEKREGTTLPTPTPLLHAPGAMLAWE